MTDPERILRVIRGEQADCLPWVPRLKFWYRGRVRTNSLPARLRGLSLKEIVDLLGVGYYCGVPDLTARERETDMIDGALGILNLPVLPYQGRLDRVERRVVSRGRQT